MKSHSICSLFSPHPLIFSHTNRKTVNSTPIRWSPILLFKVAIDVINSRWNIYECFPISGRLDAALTDSIRWAGTKIITNHFFRIHQTDFWDRNRLRFDLSARRWSKLVLIVDMRKKWCLSCPDDANVFGVKSLIVALTFCWRLIIFYT